MRLSLAAAAAVCVSTIAAHATTIVYSSASNVSVSAINGLAVDGNTYNVTFMAYSPSTTFQGNQTGARDAAQAIINVLNSSTAGYIYNRITGSDSSFVVQYDGTDMGYLIGARGKASNWTIMGTDSFYNSAAIFTVAPAPTPEPSSIALLGTGLVGIFGVLRRKFSRV